MRTTLIVLFSMIFLAMTYVTVGATLDRGIFDAGRDLWPDRWFRATLMDAYCGFITFYVWVAYKETQWVSRLMWFVLIMTLGNFAMSAYVLRQLWRLDSFTWDGLLLRSTQTENPNPEIPLDRV